MGSAIMGMRGACGDLARTGAACVLLAVSACFTDPDPASAGGEDEGESTGAETSSGPGSSSADVTSQGSASMSSGTSTVDSTGSDGSSSSGVAEESTTGSSTTDASSGSTGAEVASVPAGAIVPFATGPCPAGWTEIVQLRDRIARGDDGDGTVGEIGGDDTHAHTVAGHGHTITQADGTHTHQVTLAATASLVNFSDEGGFAFPSGGHTHVASSSSAGGMHGHTVAAAPQLDTSEVSSLPPFREVVFCAAVDDIDELPVGALVMVEAGCPPDIDEAMEYRDRFIMGHDADASPAEDGGSATHTHTFDHAHGNTTSSAEPHTHTGSTGGAAGPNASFGGANVAASSPNHSHSFSLAQASHAHGIPSATATGAASHMPEYREVTVCEPAAAAAAPPEMLLLFESECPADFAEVQAYQGLYLRGHDGDFDFAETGGSAQHAHGTAHDHGGETQPDAHGHTLASIMTTDAGNMVDAGGSPVAADDHSHPLGSTTIEGGGHVHTIAQTDPGATAALDNVPPFHEVVVCVRE